MCGVPVHAADDYLQKLIALGFRVAVCEQIEDPAEAKKRGGKSVVRRDVVRLVTPGTITEEKLLSAVGVELSDGAWAGEGRQRELLCAGVDGNLDRRRSASPRPMPTGCCRTSCASIPKELIVADAVFHDAELKAVVRRARRASPARSRRRCSIPAAAPGRVARFYGIATPDSFGAFQPRRAVGDLGCRRLCREDAEGRAAAARFPRARGERRDAVHRPGDARQSGADEDAVGQPRRLAVQGDRPHGDGRGRAHAGRPADLAADRPAGDQPAAGFGRLLPRRDKAVRSAAAGAEARRRHAARADQAGAQPRRPARPRRAALGFFRGGRDRRAVCRRAAAGGTGRRQCRRSRRCPGNSPRISTRRWPTSCRC